MMKFLLTAFVLISTVTLFSPQAQAQTTAPVALSTTATLPVTVVPAPRAGKKSRAQIRHAENLKRIQEGPVDLLFLGDSITDRWSSSPLVWNKYFGKWNPANFGVGGDRTQNVLWRIEKGELDGISPKVVVLMIGTNNANSDSTADIITGIRTIIEAIHEKLPDTKILLHGIFPREARMKDGKLVTKPLETVRAVNKELPKLAQEGKVRYLDITDEFLVDGKVPKDIMPDGVHPVEKGYEIWAKAITPVLEEMMK